MQQDARDLANAGFYLCCVCVLIGSCALAGAAALKQASESPIYNWAASALEISHRETTRASQMVANAREIQAALAKPIPRPEPLPPITAKLAYGQLRTVGSGAIMANHKPKLPKEALDAMAMDTSVAQKFRASSAVTPELHKVY